MTIDWNAIWQRFCAHARAWWRTYLFLRGFGPWLVLILLSPAALSAQDSNMRANLDLISVVTPDVLFVSGWAVGNGFVPEKALYLDGQYWLTPSPMERTDVCGVLHSTWHWACDDERVKFCAVTNAPPVSTSCVGFWAWIDLTQIEPGPHVVQVCTSHLARTSTAPRLECSLPRTFVH